jgi:hypothetical protein
VWGVSIREFNSAPKPANSVTTEWKSKDEQTYEDTLQVVDAYLIPHKYRSSNSEFKTMNKRDVWKLLRAERQNEVFTRSAVVDISFEVVELIQVNASFQPTNWMSDGKIGLLTI